jgi:hypothetical protein
MATSNLPNYDSSCGVCLESYTDLRLPFNLETCPHYFCFDCIKRIQTQCGKMCPLCRKAFLKDANMLKPNTQVLLMIGKDSLKREIQIFIKELQGTTRTLTVRLGDSLYSLKKMVEAITGIPYNVMRLVYCSKNLAVNGDLEAEKKALLQDYAIQNNGTIFLLLRLKGGYKDD